MEWTGILTLSLGKPSLSGAELLHSGTLELTCNGEALMQEQSCHFL